MTAIAVAPYSLPLHRGAQLGPQRLERREGILVTWSDRHSGMVGRGEAAPAYWLGEPDVATVADELRRLVASTAANDLIAAIDDGTLRASPAARCALDTALLDLRGQQQAISLAVILGAERESSERIDIAALIAADTPSEVRADAERWVEAGYRVLKLKVGGRPPTEDVARIEALREGGQGRILLRLDANRAWHEDEAVEVLAAVAASDVEYVEEPLRTHDLVALARLRRRAGVPIAMDESVTSAERITRLAECGACDTIVLKLSRIGGPRAAMALAMHARSLGVGITLTDAIETPVGRAAAVHVAAALPRPRQAVGLGGALLLAADPVQEPAVAASPSVVAEGPGLGLR